MLSPEQINEIHRLHFVEKWSQRGFWSVMGSVLGSDRYCADYAESSGFAALTGTAETEYN